MSLTYHVLSPYGTSIEVLFRRWREQRGLPRRQCRVASVYCFGGIAGELTLGQAKPSTDELDGYEWCEGRGHVTAVRHCSSPVVKVNRQEPLRSRSIAYAAAQSPLQGFRMFCQHMSVYVSIRQHTSALPLLPQNPPPPPNST